MSVKSMHRIYNAVDRALRIFEFASVLIAAGFLLITMVLVSSDALLRYAFNAPLAFQYTLTEDYLLIGIIVMAMSWGFRTGGYIRIAGLAALLPSQLMNFLIRAGILVSSAYVGVLAWTAGRRFVAVFMSNEAKIGVIDWPTWLSWIWIPVGCGLLALRLVLIAFGPEKDLHAEHEPVEEI
jgi:TRAP-type C4-dicarboxylate transport system permease small subunit